MKNIYLVQGHPRSRTGLLRRIFDSCFQRVETRGPADIIETKKVFDSVSGSDATRSALVASFIGSLRETTVFFDIEAGGGGWRDGSGFWSWVQTALGARIFFVVRDEAETEISMEATYEKWVPSFAPCSSRAIARMKEQRKSMAAYAAMNPDSCRLVDSGLLASPESCFAEVSAICGMMGIAAPSQESVLEAVSVIEGTWREHVLSRPSGIRDTDGIPDFHSLPPAPPDSGRGVSGKRVSPDPPPWLRETPAVPERVCESLEVHIISWGSRPWMGPCVSSIRMWCAKHGYPLEVWEKSPGFIEGKYTTLDIIRSFLAGGRGKMLFIDADVFIHPQAPGFPDLGGFSSRVEFLEKTISHFGGEMDRVGVSCPEWKYRNSGVWSCDRESAGIFIDTVDSNPAVMSGYREQHQFNLWWFLAQRAGMEVSDLPPEWNCFTRIEGRVAWFSHFAGKRKDRHIREARENGIIPGTWMDSVGLHWPRSARAIVYPWIESPSAWDELRYSLRSVDAHFADRECPVYVIGPKRPEWLADGGRVVFVRVSYKDGWFNGLRRAFEAGTQIADRVMWMNDDIYFLRETGWEDMETALTEGEITPQLESRLAESRNGWRRGMASVTSQLSAMGFGRIMRFATHTPMIFDRARSLEVLHVFDMPYKGGFANAYHNYSGVAHRPMDGDKANAIPLGGERFLNHNDATLTDDLKRWIESAFPEKSRWEK